MTTRNQFIATVRRRLQDGIPTNPLRPLVDIANNPIDYAVDLSDPAAAFSESAGRAGVEFVGRPDETLETVVARVLELVDPRVVAVSIDPECDGIEAILRGAGVAVAARNDATAVATADLGITGALSGVALTGSVIVDSQRAGGRLVSILPRIHLVLLPAERIVATPGDFFRSVDAWYAGDLPSNVVFITGPSRSADIELQITKGVHGPQRVLMATR